MRQVYNLLTKERFCDQPDLSTRSKTLEAVKVHASTYSVPTVVIPKLGCGQDQVNWQEVVKLLQDIFAYANVKILVNTVEENGVYAKSAESDVGFYAEGKKERYSEKFFLKNRELET